MSDNNIKREPTPEEDGDQSYAMIRPGGQPQGQHPRAPQAIDDIDVQTGGAAGTAGGRVKSAKKSVPKKPPVERDWNFTHNPPTLEERKKNGRVSGRNLITWNRPRMAEKLLLHIMYECGRHRVEIPWDHVAHRMHPGSTGGAVVQHLNRLRASLVAEGHLVPPICQKPGSRVYVDPNIRGYIRKFTDTDDLTTTRTVMYNEPLEDRRFNIPDSWDTRIPSTSQPDDQDGSSFSAGPQPAPSTSASAAPRKATAKRGRKRSASGRIEKRDLSADPTDLDSDGDYAPGPKPARKQPRRSTRPTRSRFSGNYNGDDEEEDETASRVAPNTLRERLAVLTPWDEGLIEIDDDTEPVDNSNVFNGMSRDLIGRTRDYEDQGRRRMVGNPAYEYEGNVNNLRAQYSGGYLDNGPYEQHRYARNGPGEFSGARNNSDSYGQRHPDTRRYDPRILGPRNYTRAMDTRPSDYDYLPADRRPTFHDHALGSDRRSTFPDHAGPSSNGRQSFTEDPIVGDRRSTFSEHPQLGDRRVRANERAGSTVGSSTGPNPSVDEAGSSQRENTE